MHVYSLTFPADCSGTKDFQAIHKYDGRCVRWPESTWFLQRTYDSKHMYVCTAHLLMCIMFNSHSCFQSYVSYNLWSSYLHHGFTLCCPCWNLTGFWGGNRNRMTSGSTGRKILGSFGFVKQVGFIVWYTLAQITLPHRVWTSPSFCLLNITCYFTTQCNTTSVFQDRLCDHACGRPVSSSVAARNNCDPVWLPTRSTHLRLMVNRSVWLKVVCWLQLVMVPQQDSRDGDWRRLWE